jgi:Fur family ferric uptake transcriptional regulator
MLTRAVRRMTNQRQVVLEELLKLRSHPTAEELHQLVRRRLPKISMATVYRNLEILSSEGLAQKMDMAGAQRRFDGDTSNHYHVRCVACGRVEDVDFDPIPNIEQAIGDRSAYKVLSHRLEFIGLCPDCLATQQAELGI